MPSINQILLRPYEGDEGTAYIELRDHPEELVFGLVARTVDVHNLIEGYEGPRISIAFDKDSRPVGIEIIYPSDDDQE